MLQGSFISHMNTSGGAGAVMGLAMELIMTPLVERLMEGRKIGLTKNPGLAGVEIRYNGRRRLRLDHLQE